LGGDHSSVLLVTVRLWGHAVARLVEALFYKPEGRGIDSRWCHWHWQSFWPHSGPGINTVSSSKEYQEYYLGVKDGRCLGLTTLPSSCSDCLEIWDSQPPGTRIALPCTFTIRLSSRRHSVNTYSISFRYLGYKATTVGQKFNDNRDVILLIILPY
jgi:hypothetical protein